MPDRTGVLVALARAIAARSDVSPLPLRLCHACVDSLGAQGGAITIAYTRPERVTLCATDEVAAWLEDIQDVLGQGPGRDAFLHSEAVRATLDDGEGRWPELAAARHSVGDVNVLALPMRPDGMVLGVLTVHGPLDPAERIAEGEAQFLADALGGALLSDPVSGPGSTADSLRGPWAGRAVVHQATGMVVAQLKINPEDALVLLRAHAYAHGMTLDSVAVQITEFRLDFTMTDDAASD